MIKELKEAKKILGLKRNLTVEDYKTIKGFGNKMKSKDNIELYGWILEALSQRLPEIAAQEGNYNFLEEEDK